MLGGMLGFLLLAAAGCATGIDTVRTESQTWGLTERLDQGIAQLTASIESLDRRMSEQQLPSGADDGMGELQTLDLSAWQLRRQQWVLQREHLAFAKELLGLAKERPDEKAGLVEQWVTHVREYMNQLEDLRQRRYALERKRLQIEAQVIEHALR